MENNKELEKLKADFNFDRNRAFATGYIESSIERVEEGIEKWKSRGGANWAEMDKQCGEVYINAKNTVKLFFEIRFFSLREREEYEKKIERIFYGEDYVGILRRHKEYLEKRMQEYEEMEAKEAEVKNED